jgi:hypothetical protein
VAALKVLRAKSASLQFEDGTAIPCEFTIRQTTDAGLRLKLTLPEPQALSLQLNLERKPVRLVGAVHDGRPLTLEGDFLLVRAKGDTVTYVCQGPDPLRLGVATSSAGTLAVFLTNCFFDGTEIVHRPGGAWYRGALPLDIAGRRITLELRYGAYVARRSLRETQRTAITARATTETASIEDRQAALTIIDRVSRLLSLATGTLVSRVQWTLKTAGGREVLHEYSSPPLRPYKPRELLDPNDGAVLKQFIETAYPIYVSLDDVYQFGKAIHAKIDTAVGGFLETRALAASSLVEYLVGRYANHNGLRPPLHKEAFQKARPLLTTRVETVLMEVFGDELSENDRREMATRTHGFNDSALRRKLRFIVDGLALGFTDEELRSIRNTRNALAHRMRFYGDDPREMRKEWTRLIHFVDVTLLRLLGHRGPYIDCRTWQLASLPEAPSRP